MHQPMVTMQDPENFQRATSRLLDRIALPENRTTVRRYVRDRQVLGLKLGTILSDLNGVVGFCIHLGATKRLEDVVRDDILDYLTTASRQRMWRNADKSGKETITQKVIPLSPSTLGHRKIVLRAFFKWLRGTEDYPPEVRNLGPRPKDPDRVVASRLINDKDLKNLLLAQPTARGRAILAVLYETGFRAQEFCSLNINSVRFEGQVAYIRLPKGANGLKTGAREAFIIDSIRYLQQWLEEHPTPAQPDAPLFVSMSGRKPRARFTNGSLYTFCIIAGKRARLPMSTNPHLFRHSAATEKASLGWNETQLRHYFGWTKDSDMPSRYVHLAAKDCERMELARRGLLTTKDEPQPALRPIICKKCYTTNQPTAAFCENCQLPVSPAAVEVARHSQLEAFREEMARLVTEQVKRLTTATELGVLPPGQAAN